MTADDGRYVNFGGYVFLGGGPGEGACRYQLREVEPLADAKGVNAPAQVDVISLADDETRPITRRWPDGSWACPFCESPVIPGRPRPDWDQGCPNPACRVNMTAGQLAEAQRDDAAREARRREQAALDEFHRRQREERERADAERWAQVAAEAARRGACEECLRKSYWRTSPRFVRHRRPDYHVAPGAPAGAR